MEMARSKKQSGLDDSIEKKAEDFGEEVEALGRKFEKKMERHGKRLEACCDESECGCCFGTSRLFWPLFSAVMCLVVLFLAILALESWNWFANREIAAFLRINLGLFFCTSLFFGYAHYFSKRARKAYRPFSPLVTAAELVFAFWIAFSILAILGKYIPMPGMGSIISLFMENILPWFVLIALLGYAGLIFSGSGNEKEVVEMAETKNTEKENKVKRLYRSGKERILGGVCGGVAEYFNVDPTIVRLVWVLLALMGLIGVVLYIIAWIIVPRNPKDNWN
jgi:phage shock protein PspC (stress-responsive transcriptional regulator)